MVIFGPLADITRESLESNNNGRYEIARSDQNAAFDSSSKGESQSLNQFSFLSKIKLVLKR